MNLYNFSPNILASNQYFQIPISNYSPLNSFSNFYHRLHHIQAPINMNSAIVLGTIPLSISSVRDLNQEKMVNLQMNLHSDQHKQINHFGLKVDKRYLFEALAAKNFAMSQNFSAKYSQSKERQPTEIEKRVNLQDDNPTIGLFPEVQKQIAISDRFDSNTLTEKSTDQRKIENEVNKEKKIEDTVAKRLKINTRKGKEKKVAAQLKKTKAELISILVSQIEEFLGMKNIPEAKVLELLSKNKLSIEFSMTRVQSNPNYYRKIFKN